MLGDFQIGLAPPGSTVPVGVAVAVAVEVGVGPAHSTWVNSSVELLAGLWSGESLCTSASLWMRSQASASIVP